MAIARLFENLADRFNTSASVKTVYGEPVPAEGRTVIPVAKVAYGFGGGFGAERKEGMEEEEGEGGGGGEGNTHRSTRRIG